MLHQYKLNGYNIILDVYSGSVHSVDEVAYDVIALLDKGLDRQTVINDTLKKHGDKPDVTKEELEELLADIDRLIAEGSLFAPDTYEDKAFDFKERSTVIKALCLHVAHTCNLSCDYCFASQGKYHGERALMSFEVGKQAIDFLVANSGTRRNLEVDFFGGEPLMNLEVVKQIVAYARSIEKEKNKNFRFTLTTNGLLLNEEVTEFLNKECHNVVLSLDGRREVHDRLRKTPGGQGSYDIIVPKFQQFVRQRGDREYYMRGTYTHNNIDFTNDLFHMLDLGFDKLSMEPVVCAPNDPYALTEEDIATLFEQYELLAK
ncbi:MAG: thioether cross-link-forming SCIFF peptide maturase, partial [Papillibacter sp.]|nr:thioether cross-link-forming SCIFF peptide maturase [Papillibacter sp.]